MAKVQDLVDEINQAKIQAEKEGKTYYNTASSKDEVAVMKAMMNDTSFKVAIWGPDGITGYYCPEEEYRESIVPVIKATTGASEDEIKKNLSDYEFKNAEAQSMINFSKEFINTYLNTGRKLPMGAREKSNIALLKKDVPGGKRLYPAHFGNKDEAYKSKESYVKDYSTIRVFGSCPQWRICKDGEIPDE